MAESSNRRRKFNHQSPAAGDMTLRQLPSELLATILTKLDVPSICAVTLTSKTFRICGQHILKFIPNFHLTDVAAPIDPLRRVLLPNDSLRSLKLDCRRLDEEAIDHIIQPGLTHLSLRNCHKINGNIFCTIGERCKDLRSLYVSSIDDSGELELHDGADLEELLQGCTQLEELALMFDATLFPDTEFTSALNLASDKLTCLRIGFIPEEMVIDLLSPTLPPNQSPNHIPPPVFSNIHKLCLTVDRISNTMLNVISNTLVCLTHFDLRDHPILESNRDDDLTDEGLRLINKHGRLKHLSLIRSQEYNPTFFRYVTDEGFLSLAANCKNMESISLAGFCNITDTGFKTLLHACTNLHEFKVTNGTRMTDLVFHDMHATSLGLASVSLRNCKLLTNAAVLLLALNRDLIVLDFRHFSNIGDEALQVISKLHKLRTLLLDYTRVTDLGLSYFQKGAKHSLVKLSVSGCHGLTSKCVSSIFSGGSNRELKELDLSGLHNFTNGAVLFLAKNRIPLVHLRMRRCPLIGDMSVMVLASMTMADGDMRHGSSLRSLDLYNCDGITKLVFQWLKKPYFPGLRWLGLSGSKNPELVDLLALNRPFLNLMTRGELFQTDRWNDFDDILLIDYDGAFDPDKIYDDSDDEDDDKVDNDDGNKDDNKADNDDADVGNGDADTDADDDDDDDDDGHDADDDEIMDDGNDIGKASNARIVGVDEVVGWEKCLLVRLKLLGLKYIRYY